MTKPNFSLIGLLQALGIVIYCILIACLFRFFGKVFIAPPEFLGMALMLALLVFSAAVTGSIVFVYPAYLALNGKIKPALTVLLFTLLYSLLIIALIVGVLFVLR